MRNLIVGLMLERGRLDSIILDEYLVIIIFEKLIVEQMMEISCLIL
ncbi:hypothetical protein IKI14_05535 [bacterium]|nr:hypothetical protein [bacterium]